MGCKNMKIAEQLIRLHHGDTDFKSGRLCVCALFLWHLSYLSVFRHLLEIGIWLYHWLRLSSRKKVHVAGLSSLILQQAFLQVLWLVRQVFASSSVITLCIFKLAALADWTGKRSQQDINISIVSCSRDLNSIRKNNKKNKEFVLQCLCRSTYTKDREQHSIWLHFLYDYVCS